MNIRKILFPTDFTPHAEQAFPHALYLGEEFGADVHMFHAVVLHAADPANPERAFPDLEVTYEEIRAWAAEQMEATAEAADRPEVRLVHAEERAIAPAPAIVEYAEEEDVDLVVMATHGRRGVRRMLLGSVAEEVLRIAPCPVLTVRPRPEGPGPGRPERIVVPVDFSEHSDLALASAAELARRTGAALSVLHVVPEMSYPDPYFADAAALRSMAKAAQEEVPQALARNVDRVVGDDVSADTHMRVGSPAATVAEFAEEEGADMVVVASHGRTGVKRMFLGSVAEGIVRRAPCPVLTLKAFGKNLLEEGA